MYKIFKEIRYNYVCEIYKETMQWQKRKKIKPNGSFRNKNKLRDI